MDHLKAIAIKFIATLALLTVILGMFYDMSFGNVFLITLALGIVSYIVGDLLILQRTNNTTATIVDFGLSLALIWMLGAALTVGVDLFVPSLIAAIGISIFEFFFHRYMASEVFNEQEDRDFQPRTLQYQTEASEEIADMEDRDQREQHHNVYQMEPKTDNNQYDQEKTTESLNDPTEEAAEELTNDTNTNGQLYDLESSKGMEDPDKK